MVPWIHGILGCTARFLHIGGSIMELLKIFGILMFGVIGVAAGVAVTISAFAVITDRVIRWRKS